MYQTILSYFVEWEEENSELLAWNGGIMECWATGYLLLATD